MKTLFCQVIYTFKGYFLGARKVRKKCQTERRKSLQIILKNSIVHC